MSVFVCLWPAMLLCACLFAGRLFHWWVFILLICLSTVLHNDNITDCKVPWFKSAHMLCLGLCVSVCLCHLYVQTVVPDLFTGALFYLHRGPSSFWVILCVQERFALSESFLGTYLKSPFGSYIQMSDFAFTRDTGTESDRIWHLQKCAIMLMIWVQYLFIFSIKAAHNTQLYCPMSIFLDVNYTNDLDICFWKSILVYVQ